MENGSVQFVVVSYHDVTGKDMHGMGVDPMY